MIGLNGKQISHAAMALGAGAGVFMAEAVTITSNPWIDAGCYAGIAVLTALGVSVAKRSAP